MNECEIPSPAPVANLPKELAEFKSSTSQVILEKGREPGVTVSQADEVLGNGDHKASHREAGRKTANRRLRYDLTLLSCIFIMLWWPWIFLGIVYANNGIQMNKHLAKFVKAHPHSTNFAVTLIANVVCLIINTIFSFAVIRFAQEWIASHEDITVFDVSVISAFRHQTLPWNLKDTKQLLVVNRVVPASLVGICIAAFALVPSGVTSLINPVKFQKTVGFNVAELDFSTTAADCLDWLERRPDLNYILRNNTGCVANQLAEVLDSGRDSIFSRISNKSQNVSVCQLSGAPRLRFLGPIRGVLPFVPEGGHSFNTLQPSLFSKKGKLPYNYTLDQQGLTADINCSYANSSPIEFGAVPGDSIDLPHVQYNATCHGAADVLTDGMSFNVSDGNATLGFWACQSPPAAGKVPIYSIYLRGRGGYQDSIGNITCTVSAIQAAIYPVTYQSFLRVFSSKILITNSSWVNPRWMQRSLIKLGDVIREAQNSTANSVAESVITIGAPSFSPRSDQKSPKYPQFFQWMLQGILGYEAAYLRVIWSMADRPPAACSRVVNGSLSYEVLGWSAVLEEVGFLMPMTFLNTFALVCVIMAMNMARGDAEEYDPANIRYLVATRVGEHGKPKWSDRVKYRRGDLRRRQFSTGTIANNVTA